MILKDITDDAVVTASIHPYGPMGVLDNKPKHLDIICVIELDGVLVAGIGFKGHPMFFPCYDRN
jgi:hypothetical protein